MDKGTNGQMDDCAVGLTEPVTANLENVQHRPGVRGGRNCNAGRAGESLMAYN